MRPPTAGRSRPRSSTSQPCEHPPPAGARTRPGRRGAVACPHELQTDDAPRALHRPARAGGPDPARPGRARRPARAAERPLAAGRRGAPPGRRLLLGRGAHPVAPARRRGHRRRLHGRHDAQPHVKVEYMSFDIFIVLAYSRLNSHICYARIYCAVIQAVRNINTVRRRHHSLVNQYI